jgi:2-oxoisovalerate dehydrogenase E1 component
MASTINTLAFDELDAPPVVLGARNWITPPDEIEATFFPYPADFIDTIHEHILPLKGYSTKRNCSAAELIKRNRQGI